MIRGCRAVSRFATTIRRSFCGSGSTPKTARCTFPAGSQPLRDRTCPERIRHVEDHRRRRVGDPSYGESPPCRARLDQELEAVAPRRQVAPVVEFEPGEIPSVLADHVRVGIRLVGRREHDFVLLPLERKRAPAPDRDAPCHPTQLRPNRSPRSSGHSGLAMSLRCPTWRPTAARGIAPSHRPRRSGTLKPMRERGSRGVAIIWSQYQRSHAGRSCG